MSLDPDSPKPHDADPKPHGAGPKRHHDGSKPHHDGGRFRNPDTGFRERSLADVLRWRLQATRDRLPPPPSGPIPRVAPDLAFLAANATAGAAMVPAVTWIGHATVLAQLGGLSLLVDPIFSDRASPLRVVGPKRHQAPGVALAELPRIDVVLVSHNHYDHLDEASVRALARQPGGSPRFVVPLGLARWFTDRGMADVVELDWWEECAVGPAVIAMLPAQHWSGRGLADRMRSLWGGFAVLAPDCHLFYSGDTGYSRDFARIRSHFAPRQTESAGGGFDLAILPIGAWAPRWFMADQHIDVPEAVRVHQDLGAKRSLGVHWGTFALSDEALDEPPRVLARVRAEQGLADEAFFVVAIGETRRLARRGAPA